ncbi:MAG: tetratricopeptide repeat protein, partial [Methanoregula sp.]|nr:tetratricopeptide repeat protein [Methanoregula sp.]
MQFRYILTTLAVLILAACTVAPVMAGTENVTDNATTYFNIAQVAISTGDYAKAVQYFDMALADNTTLISKSDTLMYVYKDKTAALTDLGRYDEALVTANAGLAIFPKSTGLWNNKGYALFKAGRNNEAADAYGRAVTLDPTYEKGWINKGMALNAAGRYSEA